MASPFPWSVSEENCGDGFNIVDARGLRIAHTAANRSQQPKERVEKKEAKANAAAIAALGDLVDFAEAYLASQDICIIGGKSDPDTCECTVCHLNRTARAALRKAGLR